MYLHVQNVFMEVSELLLTICRVCLGISHFTVSSICSCAFLYFAKWGAMLATTRKCFENCCQMGMTVSLACATVNCVNVTLQPSTMRIPLPQCIVSRQRIRCVSAKAAAQARSVAGNGVFYGKEASLSHITRAFGGIVARMGIS